MTSIASSVNVTRYAMGEGYDGALVRRKKDNPVISVGRTGGRRCGQSPREGLPVVSWRSWEAPSPPSTWTEPSPGGTCSCRSSPASRGRGGGGAGPAPGARRLAASLAAEAVRSRGRDAWKAAVLHRLLAGRPAGEVDAAGAAFAA